MKKGNRIAVIIVLILVLLFGVGQFFAGSNLSSVTPPASNSTSTDTPATQVVVYVPPQPATSTRTLDGSCWTSSIAAPYRNDAWRCTVGNAISDPCFEIPTQKTLMCGVNPNRPDSTSTFVLSLTKPLPAPQMLQGDIPSNWAWLVKLSDGTLCTPFTGTRPFTADGQSANYGCAPGPLGNDLLIFNDLNNSSTLWTATVGTLSLTTSSLPTVKSSSTVSVDTVWQ